MTDEQYNILKNAEPHFNSAKRERIYNAPRWLTEQVINIFEAVTGKTMPHKDLSCAICVLRIYQTVGKLYDEETENRKKSEIDIITKDEEQRGHNTERISEGPQSTGNNKKNKGNNKSNKKGQVKKENS